MKINRGLSCLFVVYFAAASFQPAKKGTAALPDWVTYPIDGQLAVQLPVQPTEMDMQGVRQPGVNAASGTIGGVQEREAVDRNGWGR